MKLLCLFVLFIGVNSNFTSDGKAVPGTRATISSLPYRAELLRNGSHICAATIISATWLLTAAHCVHNHTDYEWSVLTGFDDKIQGSYRRACSNIIPYPKYNRSIDLANDIALVKLEKPIVIDELQKPIALSTRRPKMYDLMVISEYRYQNGFYGRVLQTANTTVEEFDSCALLSEKGFPKINETFCAGWMRLFNDFVRDDGGPGVIDGKLAGIGSSPDYPGMYTDVSKYREWIYLYIERPKNFIGDGEAVPGTRAAISSLPYRAELLRNCSYICAATIISATWLLTAAHCVHNHIDYKWSVLTGFDDKIQGSYRRACSNIIPHPKYNRSIDLANDIALVKLEKPIVIDELQKPIALSTRRPKMYDLMVISEYRYQNGFYGRVLQTANTTVEEFDTCALLSEKGFPKINETFCAGWMRLFSDFVRDDGGPGVIDGKLAGIGSSPDYPGMYTDVSKYSEWIYLYIERPKNFIGDGNHFKFIRS